MSEISASFLECVHCLHYFPSSSSQKFQGVGAGDAPQKALSKEAELRAGHQGGELPGSLFAVWASSMKVLS